MMLHVRAFDATEPTSRESPWRGWPRARSWLPRHLVVAPGDGTALLVTQRLDSETGLPPVAELASDFRDGFARSASAPRPWSPAVVESTPDETARVDYLTRVARAREAVRRGELRKVVVARSEQVRGVRAFDGGMQHAALVAAAPSAIAFALTLDGLGTWLGATPEVLARAEDGVVATSAIAGTALRSVDPDGSALRRDAKIAVEHALVVEAMRETLAPLLEGLEVASSPRVLVSERLVHLETQMRGLLRGRASATKPSLMEITQALHPTPALGGAPRAAALRWLREHEGLDRGYFGGPIGWEAPSGDGVLAVGIRSALLRGAEATLFAGAGIVADSDPEAEWLETAAKLGLARSTLCTPSEVVGSGRPADERTGHEPRLVEVTP
ncbi:MAG: chorismate-binding protein [Deltaproteobacteria bacterium]|nr:chorismate-binding protein [Deltaproteobacteria bacterium]